MSRLRSLRPVPALFVCLIIGVQGCRENNLTTPTAGEVEAAYTYRGELEARVQGQVAEIHATQPREQLERGGTLWAKVGPYILLFSDNTQSLFQEFPGLTAVRVVTETPEGEEVARAYLHRDALNQLTWQRALNVWGKARKHGTDKPGLLENLVQWGEEHTDFQYSPEFQPR